jgi:CheY-like chemotaxis protein
MTTALVIDDNRIPVDILCQFLRNLKIDAQPAYGSRSALQALQQQRPDIVFVDLNMPGVGGFEVISFIRREPHLEGLPVVVVTGDDSPETRERAHQEGAVGIIVKPVSPEALEEVLRKVELI